MTKKEIMLLNRAMGNLCSIQTNMRNKHYQYNKATRLIEESIQTTLSKIKDKDTVGLDNHIQYSLSIIEQLLSLYNNNNNEEIVIEIMNLKVYFTELQKRR